MTTMTTERKPPARPKPSTEHGYATKIDKPRPNRPASNAAADVDEDALTNIHGGLPTTVDPRQPASGDPHARVGPRSAPGGSPIAQEVLARVPAPPPIPAASSGPRPAARFDPHARIDDSSRTAKWDPDPPSTPAGPQHPRPDSEPLRVVSMKTPHRELPEKMQRELPVQKLRALSDIHKTPPQGLGRLAPPLDPRAARGRQWRDYVIWGSLAIVVACVVTLVIWFAAR